jgi:hypothetical protein
MGLQEIGSEDVDWCGSGLGELASCCEHCNYISYYTYPVQLFHV